MNLNKDDILDIAHTAAHEALKEAGYFEDESVADRMYIRQLRETSTKVGLRIILTVTTATVMGVIYAVFGR